MTWEKYIAFRAFLRVRIILVSKKVNFASFSNILTDQSRMFGKDPGGGGG